MRCLVLAAGYATRLYPLTEHFPKPLLPVGGKPILEWVLNGLDCPVAVISNHKFADHFKAWAEGRDIAVLDDGSTDNEHRLGAVRDIRFAVEALDIREDVLVVAGDNVLDFSLKGFADYAAGKQAPCVMCHEETRLEALRKTAVITREADGLITSYEEKPQTPKGTLAVPPFYYYRAQDVARIDEALADGCGYDAPGSFAAWLSRKTPAYAWTMPGKRYDIGDLRSYEQVKRIFGE